MHTQDLNIISLNSISLSKCVQNNVFDLGCWFSYKGQTVLNHFVYGILSLCVCVCVHTKTKGYNDALCIHSIHSDL